jgi:dipeptidyl aminopeptidase/acylaminoacyl peptidase
LPESAAASLRPLEAGSRKPKNREIALSHTLRSWCCAITFAAATWGLPTTNANSAPAPAESFFKRAQVGAHLQLSPDGSKLAFTSSGQGNRVGLYVLDLGPDGKTQGAALYSDLDIARFSWVGSDRLIFSLVDLQAGSGADNERAPGLFTIKLGDRRARMLVKRAGERWVVSGDEAADERNALTWNHELLHVPSQIKDDKDARVVIGEMFGDRDAGLTELRLHWLYLRSGATEPVKVNPPPGALHYWFDSQGEPRVVLTQRGDRQTFQWRAPGQSSWQVIGEGRVNGLPFWPVMVADDGVLYVEHRQGDAGEAVVTTFDFEKNAPRTKPLIAVPGFDVDAVPVRDPSRGTLAGIRLDADAETTVWLSPGQKALQAVADARLPGRVNRISCQRCHAPDALMLVQSWSDRHPGEVLLYRHAEQRWQRVMTVQPGITPQTMATVDLQRIRARDGRQIPVWITLPAGHKAGQRYPTIVMVHGGPWVRSGRWEWDPLNQFLASRGYLVVQPEFRGSDGYGRAHLEAGFKQFGQAMQNDVADALLWARQTGLADEKRACIAGASYGGYATLMGLAQDPDLYKCGAAWVALTDLMLYVKGSFWVEDDISGNARRYSLFDRVGDPDAEADRKMLIEHSPVNRAAQIKAPVLLAFGEEDKRIPLAHGHRMRDALRKAGRDPVWITYPGEAHGWRKEQTQVEFAKRLEAFFAQHLRSP